jgi:hypothetical protein
MSEAYLEHSIEEFTDLAEEYISKVSFPTVQNTMWVISRRDKIGTELVLWNFEYNKRKEDEKLAKEAEEKKKKRQAKLEEKIKKRKENLKKFSDNLANKSKHEIEQFNRFETLARVCEDNREFLDDDEPEGVIMRSIKTKKMIKKEKPDLFKKPINEIFETLISENAKFIDSMTDEIASDEDSQEKKEPEPTLKGPTDEELDIVEPIESPRTSLEEISDELNKGNQKRQKKRGMINISKINKKYQAFKKSGENLPSPSLPGRSDELKGIISPPESSQEEKNENYSKSHQTNNSVILESTTIVHKTTPIIEAELPIKILNPIKAETDIKEKQSVSKMENVPLIHPISAPINSSEMSGPTNLKIEEDHKRETVHSSSASKRVETKLIPMEKFDIGNPHAVVFEHLSINDSSFEKRQEYISYVLNQLTRNKVPEYHRVNIVRMFRKIPKDCDFGSIFKFTVTVLLSCLSQCRFE